MMNRTTRTTILFSAALLFGGMAASSYAAEGQFDKTHPRREQVNKRIHNQDRRIHREVREGDMSKAKAARLHRKDHHIRKEERAMAAKHRGHITKAEKRKLNRQENNVSKKIGS
ncbi:MAG TPA: hypothetical protein VMV88_10850 [Gallionella sp.]|nr:hypothetical protein [Gallionella sp.]